MPFRAPKSSQFLSADLPWTVLFWILLFDGSEMDVKTVQEGSSGGLGVSLGGLGPLLGALGPSLAGIGGLLGRLEGVLGRSWRLLGPLGLSFGVVLDVVLIPRFDSDAVSRFNDAIRRFDWLILLVASTH